jgi:hypothetical protein
MLWRHTWSTLRGVHRMNYLQQYSDIGRIESAVAIVVAAAITIVVAASEDNFMK